jgi:hypothetical protein
MRIWFVAKLTTIIGSCLLYLDVNEVLGRGCTFVFTGLLHT